ncbi:Saccharopine dehydrogenase-domain-containing protein [Talaromyces proteolyticus]|uniref:Saccharopine dehydrogenase-domain-containing protein n=1 Tax=Talaromyces proteolyticus TaxID=1131652 RepID=A0AAD4KTU5_9EURO|nr:Saccharopine dehydrogenase-domain-containing protein [Talaromyces proteolyticus]KAH8698665.1 Saccharopine dehydrogenase-domain-containing protein [Talaromyces proteolyticus]
MTADRVQVVFIGAAGEMCRVAIERFAMASNASLVLADINTKALEPLVAKLPSERVITQKLDLFNEAALDEIVQGASLVVLGAGPYSRTSKPVLEACLKRKVPYLDFDDDVESTTAALSLHDLAKKANVPFYIGCGASPGMSNVLVVDATQNLDTVDTIDICWLVGDERPGIGKAVLEHLMHIAAGPCLTWANNKPTLNESWVETAYAPMVGHVGETLLHETAHPEPVTLPRIFPSASRIRCLGGLDPAPFNGIARGLGVAVRREALSLSEAVDFVSNLINNPPSTSGWTEMFSGLSAHMRGGDISVKELWQLVSYGAHALGPWRYALMGMIDQIRSGECTTGEILSFVISSVRGQTAQYRGSLLVRAVGTRNGHPAMVIKRTAKCGKDSFLMKDMAAITGNACAAFIIMALEDGQKRAGVFAPEDWAAPNVFYSALEKFGTPREEIVESLIA